MISNRNCSIDTKTTAHIKRKFEQDQNAVKKIWKPIKLVVANARVAPPVEEVSSSLSQEAMLQNVSVPATVLKKMGP
ncbi:MAG TPA: hypothetical protein VHA13_01945 [Gammaproteobacteria bacterium]|nr:hypothetical protein [Gammaproteobacteria bacterium]